MFNSEISAVKDQARIEHRESGMVVADNIKYVHTFEDNKRYRQRAALRNADGIVQELEHIEEGLELISRETITTHWDDRKDIYSRSIAAVLVGLKDPVLVEVLKKGLEIYSHFEKV